VIFKLFSWRICKQFGVLVVVLVFFLYFRRIPYQGCIGLACSNSCCYFSGSSRPAVVVVVVIWVGGVAHGSGNASNRINDILYAGPG